MRIMMMKFIMMMGTMIRMVRMIMIVTEDDLKPGYERRDPLDRFGRGHPPKCLTQCDHLKDISAAKNAKNMLIFT